MTGIYIVSARTDLDHQQAQAAAFDLVSAEHDNPALLVATPFGAAGYGVEDLIAMFDGLAVFASFPEGDSPVPGWDEVGRGMRKSDSEGHPLRSFMGPLDDRKVGTRDWLRPAEAAHATWPRLFDVLGMSVHGVACDENADHNFSVPATRVPRRIRLRSGWDYDENWVKVDLTPEEAARRLTALIPTSD